MVFLIAVLAGIGVIWLAVRLLNVIAQGIILAIVGAAILVRALWRAILVVATALRWAGAKGVKRFWPLALLALKKPNPPVPYHYYIALPSRLRQPHK